MRTRVLYKVRNSAAILERLGFLGRLGELLFYTSGRLVRWTTIVSILAIRDAQHPECTNASRIGSPSTGKYELPLARRVGRWEALLHVLEPETLALLSSVTYTEHESLCSAKCLLLRPFICYSCAKCINWRENVGDARSLKNWCAISEEKFLIFLDKGNVACREIFSKGDRHA